MKFQTLHMTDLVDLICLAGHVVSVVEELIYGETEHPKLYPCFTCAKLHRKAHGNAWPMNDLYFGSSQI